MTLLLQLILLQDFSVWYSEVSTFNKCGLVVNAPKTEILCQLSPTVQLASHPQFHAGIQDLNCVHHFSYLGSIIYPVHAFLTPKSNQESVLLHRLLVVCQTVFSLAEILPRPPKWPSTMLYAFLHYSMVVSHGLHTDPTFVILNSSISAVSSAFLGWHGLIVFQTLPSLRALAVSALNA